MRPTFRGRNCGIKQFIAVNIPRFDVVAAAVLVIQVLWGMTAYILVNSYRRFGRDFCGFQGVVSEMPVTLHQSALIHTVEHFNLQAVHAYSVQQSCVQRLTLNDFKTRSYHDC